MARRRNKVTKKIRKERHDLAKPTVLEVKQLIKNATGKVGETKYSDLENQIQVNSSGGNTVTCLHGPISQGLLDISNRVGDVVTPKSITFNQTMYPSGHSAGIRQLIIQTKGENGLIPNITQILAYTNSTNGELYNSPLRWDNMKEFRVLHDKRIMLKQSVGGITDEVHFNKFTIPANKIRPYQYIAATTMTANGGIFMWNLSDAAVGSGSLLSNIIRTKYKDV